MGDVKSFLASRAIWGGLIALAAGLLGLLGYSIDAKDQATLLEGLTALGSVAGGLVAIYGRVKASKKIAG